RGTPREARPASPPPPSVREDPFQAALGLGKRRLQLRELVAVTEADVVGRAEVLPGNEQHAVLGADLLDHVERADPLTVLHIADGAGLRRVPAEGVADA